MPVLVLSMHDEALYAERVLRAGARGYISKHEAASTLSKAIRQVLNGQVYLSEGMTASLLEKVSGRKSPTTTAGMELLADRELEVFQLVGRGYNGREIGRRCCALRTTVDTYCSRIKEEDSGCAMRPNSIAVPRSGSTSRGLDGKTKSGDD